MVIPYNTGQAIKLNAERFKIPASIVYGVCMTESGLEPLSVRYEPNYRWLFKPQEVRVKGCSVNTETMMQKTSWGLMQVMGAVFREYGYRGWLTAIINDVNAQVEFGCRHLSKKIVKYGQSAGILAYNSGSPIKNKAGGFTNQYYLDKVLDASKQW